MTTKQMMLGKTPSIQYIWRTNNGDTVAEFKIWDWWDGKNVSDLEISEKYRGLGLSYQLLDYATKKCDARNLAVKKDNTIAKHVYDKYGFYVTEEDEEYYYMSLGLDFDDTIQVFDNICDSFPNNTVIPIPDNSCLEVFVKDTLIECLQNIIKQLED